MPNNEQEGRGKPAVHIGHGIYVAWRPRFPRSAPTGEKVIQLADGDDRFILPEDTARKLYQFLGEQFGPKTWTDMMNQYHHIRESRTVTQQIRTLNGGG